MSAKWCETKNEFLMDCDCIECQPINGQTYQYLNDNWVQETRILRKAIPGYYRIYRMEDIGNGETIEVHTGYADEQKARNIMEAERKRKIYYGK